MRANALANLLLVLAIYGLALVPGILWGWECMEWVQDALRLDRSSLGSGILSLLVWMFSGAAVFASIRYVLVRLLLEEDK